MPSKNFSKNLANITIAITLIMSSSACFKKTVIYPNPVPMRYQQSKRPEQLPVYHYDNDSYYVAPSYYKTKPVERYYKAYETTRDRIIPTVGLILISTVILGSLFLL